ncbi:hypothetical protein BS47DRAFT_711963 [Hydnum rufescens UP504]|uniref:Uncharacterized protein n=1 Tax=Hydnum rufescens UP504 TaxID=1448309 RepID=A0A9P6B202_9AGAM|nr:hypothetical protein BS47DRAFT_711963 [Hydnum rufescens UP504]
MLVLLNSALSRAARMRIVLDRTIQELMPLACIHSASLIPLALSPLNINRCSIAFPRPLTWRSKMWGKCLIRCHWTPSILIVVRKYISSPRFWLNNTGLLDATAKIPSREEHTLMPSSVPIEIAPESGGRPPYGGLNRDGYDTQPPTSATGGSALHSQYSAVPELMEPAIPPPTTQSETPKTTSGSAPPSGPHHTTLLEPMATDIHPSYYESAVHQRVSSTGIMSVTPVLRARTPVRSPDDGLVYGASASRSLSQRNYRQPSQHISSGLQSSPTSDQKAGSGNPLHAQLNDCLPVSPNKWPESGLLRIIASPISGGHTERPVTSSAPVDESSPSAAGYEESPRQAVSPSTTDRRPKDVHLRERGSTIRQVLRGGRIHSLHQRPDL